jgi:hypothetical protein
MVVHHIDVNGIGGADSAEFRPEGCEIGGEDTGVDAHGHVDQPIQREAA